MYDEAIHSCGHLSSRAMGKRFLTCVVFSENKIFFFFFLSETTTVKEKQSKSIRK